MNKRLNKNMNGNVAPTSLEGDYCQKKIFVVMQQKLLVNVNRGLNEKDEWW